MGGAVVNGIRRTGEGAARCATNGGAKIPAIARCHPARRTFVTYPRSDRQRAGAPCALNSHFQDQQRDIWNIGRRDRGGVGERERVATTLPSALQIIGEQIIEEQKEKPLVHTKLRRQRTGGRPVALEPHFPCERHHQRVPSRPPCRAA